MLKTQLKLMFYKKGFKISFTFMIIFAVFLPVCYMITSFIANDDISNVVGYQYAYYFDKNSVLSNCSVYIIPILSALPFSFSYIEEKKLGCHAIFISKCGAKNYYFTKAYACFLGAFLIFFVPSLINIFICYCFFPDSNQDMNGICMVNMLFNEYLYIDENIIFNPEFNFLNIFIYFPLLYNVILTLMLSLLSGVCAVISYTITLFAKKYYYFSFFPTVILFLIGIKYYQFYQNGIISKYILNFNLADYAISDSPRGKNYLFFVLILVIITIFSLFLINKKSKEEQV